MRLWYFFFIIIIFIADFNVSASNSDTVKTDTTKTEIQDFTYSFFNNFKLNPSITGIHGEFDFELEAGIDKPLRTYGDFYQPQYYSFLFDVAIGKKRKLALGLFLNEAKGGAIENLSGGFAVSKTFYLSKNKSDSAFHKLSVGVSTEYNIVSFAWDKITFGDMIDPRYGFVYNTQETKPGSLSKQFINFSAGIWYNNPLVYCGFSVHNITQPNLSLYSASIIPREFYISSGGNLKLSKQFSLHPSFNVSIIKGFKGKLNSYSPAIICSYHQKYIAGFSYMDLNKIAIHTGCAFAKHLELFVTCAFSTNADLYQFGTLSYLGGKLQYNIKN
jgi:type IX secretion system PorP/SprF family membrane protein